MKVLVTGANGLLGHHVVMELLKRKIEVNIIVRQTTNIYFDLAAVNVIVGDFTVYETLQNASMQCDAIIHIAALTATHLLHYSDYFKVNVEGTKLILKVAKEQKINKIVYISSANTIGYGTEQDLANERSSIKFPFTNSFYAQSKMASEELIIAASKKANKHFIIINPTFMIGAFDTKPSSGKLLLMGYNRKLLFIPKGGKNFVDAQSVAFAVCNALTMGKNGERYLASGVNLSFRQFYAIQKEIACYQQFTFEIIPVFISFIAKIGDLIRRLGIATDLSTMNLRQLEIREFYSNDKSKRELDLPETNINFAIQSALGWFKKQGMIDT